MGNFRTDDTTTAALSDHLLRYILIIQECAASVDTYQAIEVVDGRCAPFLVVGMNGLVVGCWAKKKQFL